MPWGGEWQQLTTVVEVASKGLSEEMTLGQRPRWRESEEMVRVPREEGSDEGPGLACAGSDREAVWPCEGRRCPAHVGPCGHGGESGLGM